MADTMDARTTGLDEVWDRIEILETVHILAAICRGETIIYLNAAGARMLGLKDGDRAIGRPITSFFHPDFKGVAELGLDVFAADETVISFKFVRPDRIELDVEIWVTELEISGDRLFLFEAHDTTGFLHAARTLRSREQRLEGILNTVADGIISLDDRGVIQDFNLAAESIFGFSSSEVIGKNIRILIPIPDQQAPPTFSDTEWAKILSPRGEAVDRRKSGDTFPMEMAVRELFQGEKLSFTSIVRDITARREAEEKVLKLAHFDQLTGLPNRHLLADRMDEALKRAKRNDSLIAVMFVDLDRFKAINDEMGHAAGDEVLKIVSKHMTESARRTDSVARAGGDEFVILLEELKSVDDAILVAKKIIKAAEAPMVIGGQTCSVGFSIGIGMYPDHATDTLGLLECADRAMYAVKRGPGSEHYRVYEPDARAVKMQQRA